MNPALFAYSNNAHRHGSGGGGGGGGVLTDLSTFDIRPYLRLAGDVEYVIPNGTYTAGELSDAAHASTAGAFGGAIIVRPVTMYGATINQAAADLTINGTSSRIILVGFNFTNGTLSPAGSSVKYREWYCDHTYPSSVWKSQGYVKEGCRTVDFRDLVPPLFTTAGNPDKVEFYGTNFHHTGTAVFFTGQSSAASHHKAIGCDFSALDDGGTTDDPTDVVHPDAVASPSGSCTIDLTDSYVHAYGTHNGSSGAAVDCQAGNTVFNVGRVWQTGAKGPGFNNQSSTSPRILTVNVTDNVYSWANFPSTDPDELSYDWVESLDGVPHSGVGSASSSRIATTGTGFIHLHTANAPSGTDPATAWRAATGHGINDYVAYFTSVGWL